MNEETLYLEVDEDITTAIDRIKRAKGAKIAIVVPKRSTLLQSLINQKLLKKSASDVKKQLVLVTADRTSTHIAGRVGIAVAATLKSQASVPKVDGAEPDDVETIIEGQSAATSDQPKSPVSSAKSPLTSRPVDEIEPESTSSGSAPITSGLAAAGSAVKDKLKPPKVPNFNTLQKRLLWAGLAVTAVAVWLVANYFLASAKVTLYARGTKIPTDLDFSIDPTLTQSDHDKNLLAGQTQTLNKDLSTTFTATGTKDAGTKATGTITVSNHCYNPGTLPAGTVFTAPDGKKFTSNAEVAIADGSISGGSCSATTAAVAVTATQNGDTYNLAPTSYQVANYPSAAPVPFIRGQGNQFGGGTTKTLTVVSQADIDKAKDDLLARDRDPSKKDLEAKVAGDLRAIGESFAVTPSGIASSPALDAEATQATLTLKATYTELAVKKTDFEDYLKTAEQKEVGPGNQIYDTGIESAKITAGKKEANGKQAFHFIADAYGGAKLDPNDIANQIKSKRYGDAVEILSKLSGVEKADLNLAPAWATKVTHNTKKIKIEIKVSSVKSD